MVGMGLDPKNSLSAGGALNHCATGAPPGCELRDPPDKLCCSCVTHLTSCVVFV